MSTSTNRQENQIKAVKNSIEDYTSTILAGQSFISLITWENSHIIENALYSVGRHMDTSDNNLITKNEKITPDIVIQREQDLGYVVEIKKSLPKEEKEWEEVAKQIIKYDDSLLGWWHSETEPLEKHCVVLLIHMSRSRKFRDYFANYINVHNIKIKNDISIIEFSRSDESQPFFLLRKEFGIIQNDDIALKLYEGISIPTEKVVATYGKQLFTDCEPPVVEYTMAILWQDIFNSFERKNFDEKRKAFILEVSVNQLTIELQKLYGSTGNLSREVEFPKTPWIKRALNAFVEIGFAKKVDDENYEIFFKLLNKDPLFYFSKHRMNGKKSKDGGTQLALFN